MLKEAYRVLAPGGRAGFTVWGSKENSLLFTLIPKSFSKFKKCKKIFASSDVRSAWHLNDKKKVQNMMESIGYKNCRSMEQFTYVDMSKQSDKECVKLFVQPMSSRVKSELSGSAADKKLYEDACKVASEDLRKVLKEDRNTIGFNSIKTFTQLLALKAKFHKKIYLLRGNHECKELNRAFGFYDECHKTFGDSVAWIEFTSVYEFLPQCAIIDEKRVCIHGGLSPELEKIDTIKNVNRTRDVPHDGPLCDQLWSYPDEKNITNTTFEDSPSGAGYLWGVKRTQKFQHDNNLSLLIRGHHQVLEQGYRYFHNDLCLSIFSAPNFLLRLGNKGCFVQIDKILETLEQNILENNEEITPVKFNANPDRLDEPVIIEKNIPSHFLGPHIVIE